MRLERGLQVELGLILPWIDDAESAQMGLNAGWRWQVPSWRVGARGHGRHGVAAWIWSASAGEP